MFCHRNDIDTICFLTIEILQDQSFYLVVVGFTRLDKLKVDFYFIIANLTRFYHVWVSLDELTYISGLLLFLITFRFRLILFSLLTLKLLFDHEDFVFTGAYANVALR